MALLRAPLLLAAAAGLGAGTKARRDDSGRQLLFSDPTAPLPDVLLSRSFVSGAEGTAFWYTVALTYTPGLREDATVDRRNDEVRIYLTSSQEVFAQDDVGGSIVFQQRRNHRTQLRIRTNNVGGAGVATVPGPLPYVYAAYSTVNPAQASPTRTVGATLLYSVVCPVPTHPAYAVLDTSAAPITGTVSTGFAGCYQIVYNGFAPVLDACTDGFISNKLMTSCTDRHAAAWPATVQNPAPCVPNLPRACVDQPVAGFDGVSGLLRAKDAGGGGTSIYSGTSVSGDSDYRIYSDGSPVLRDVVDPAPKCRYCSAPGLTCDSSGSASCPVVTVNGGDQQPEEANWFFATHAAGPSWRGDLSSAAQLVFDSSNWNVPQTVHVTIRDDDVFEPHVHNRGQDAFIHHYVVAQDINLQHTYYEDIDVNDVVVSIDDNDPAIVIQSHKELRTTETMPTSISLRLASEPMYDVKVYLQSGHFFKIDQVPSVDTALADDEQMIFQDQAQYDTCFESSGAAAGRYTACSAANAVHGCANNGKYIALVSSGSSLPTTAWPTSQCASLLAQADCDAHVSSGCTWSGTSCAASAGSIFTAKDITCASFGNQVACDQHDSCTWQGAACKNIKYGYDCRSYVHFATTNWNTWQTIKVIGVPDNADEVITVSEIGYMIESRDWYYNSPGAQLLASYKANYQPTVGGVPWGYAFTSQAACEARSTFRLPLNTVTSVQRKIVFNTGKLPAEIEVDSRVLVENTDTNCAAAACCSAVGSYIVQSVDAQNDAIVVTTAVAAEATGSQCTIRMQVEPVRCVWASSKCTCTVDRSIFDTRKGVHIPRFPRVSVDSDLFGVTASDYGIITTSQTAVRWQHNVDANNGVACCQAPNGATGGTVRTINSRVFNPDDALQVVNFDPAAYASRLVHMGAKVFLTEAYGSEGGRGVTISRTECEATEGRRYWFDQFNSHPDPIGAGLATTYGLFTSEGIIQNVAIARTAADTSASGDGWTMIDVSQAEGATYAGMTAPVCPYTIVLNSSPREGRTAVVSLREDVELSTMRDHELFFFEEPSYRPGKTQNQCAKIGGSDWVNGGCFINNVPCFPSGTTNFVTTPRRTASSGSATGDPTCSSGDIILARGSTDLDVMFTDVDWDIPRRITAIALNDDVDEPTEIRTVHHSVTSCGLACSAADIAGANAEANCLAAGGGPAGSCAFTAATGTTKAECRGRNHNTGAACVADTSYSPEVPVEPVEITVIDDDIADLVVICGDGYTRNGATSQAATVDEDFIGSYDASGGTFPTFGWSEHNSAVAPFERSGPNAEDGISGSEFGGSISLVGGSTVTALPVSYSSQVRDDGIGGGGHQRSAGLPTDGYVTDLDHSDCDNFVGYPIGRRNDATPLPSPKCFKPSSVAWTHYDPYYDRYVVSGSGSTGTPYSSADSRNTYGGSPVQVREHNRGFKGIGGNTLAQPSATEPEDRYACTVHTRECLNDVLGSSEDGIGAQSTACQYGTFQVRLNSSPGTKHVRRQYVGETGTSVEEEFVYVVVSPDVTAQTMFDPAQVTFTHTGGKVDGHDTYRWDEPVTFKVVPVDDKVDERAGVTIDFTSFTVKQSHFSDLYWSYTKPFQTKSAVGSLIDAKAGSSTGRVHDHTPFRHHIRTIHTDDNDFAGVRIESATVVQSKDANSANGINAFSHNPVSVAVTEGETFGFYSMRLDTQPRKVQRQAGTHPNTVIHKASGCDTAADTTVSSVTVVGYDDYSSYTRPAVCGSVEPEETYWVDVTVTQTIHLDLATPASCPVTAPWGGGSSPSHAYLHPRFPYNAKKDAGNTYRPINELANTAADMDGYLTTCGGWQHDATFRFTPTNWDVPQYVYFYAHNDRDATQGAGHVTNGGSEAAGMTTTTLKHYVETEDTPDNMRRAGYVQRNKHGGVYTLGNVERFPFGVIQGGDASDYEHNRVTGRSTFGYTTYQTLHEFVNPTTRPTCFGTSCMNQGSGTLCCGTSMGMAPVRSSTNLLLRGSAGLAGYRSDVNQQSCPGYAVPENTEGPGGVQHSKGTVCTEGVTGASLKQPWLDDGTPCRPLYAAGQFCVPTYATSKGGMRFPPSDVVVSVSDNDAQQLEQVAIENCRQTQLMHYTDTAGKLNKREWLTDLNCNSADAGGLPGWPV